jgi:hypothetical protein
MAAVELADRDDEASRRELLLSQAASTPFR